MPINLAAHNSTTVDVEAILRPDHEATFIADQWTQWDSHRAGWKQERMELRNFLFATDTSTTTVGGLDWTNKTTLPKLTQIYDNLKAHYTAALFPKRIWFDFIPGEEEDLTSDKGKVAKEYIAAKLEADHAEQTLRRLVDDYILYGNCFATVEWVEEYTTINKDTPMEERVPKFIGPRIVRISPYDIVFNPTAAKFSQSPKIVRSVISLGGLEKMGVAEEIRTKMHHNRRLIGGADKVEKSDAYTADGFGSIKMYYNSGQVEILTFYGDFYDKSTGELFTNRKITIADRCYVIENVEFPSWLGDDAIYHAGWRDRPDNLYSMGPLDNLVGMQYRMDHLENLKADVFDQVAIPMLKVRGNVDDFEYRLGEKIFLEDGDADVEFLAPQASALAADNQIAYGQNMMEEFAGAPRQAMGIRTPGEKTAFEFGTLQESAGRIFEHKAMQYEDTFLSRILNAMLESAKRNMHTSDTILVFNDEAKVQLFDKITKEDITTRGRLKPVGSSHFSESQRRVANVSNMLQLKLSDPSIGAHISGKRMAELLAQEIGETALYEENVGLKEQQELQSTIEDMEVSHMEDLQQKQLTGT